MSQGDIEELPESDLVDDLADVGEQRLSLLSAAANARSVAMLTGTHGVVAAPLDRAVVRLPAAAALVAPGITWTARGEGLSALLSARAAAADAGDDAVTKLRAHLELAHARLAEGDREGAAAEAKAAADAAPHAPAAHAMLRVLAHGRARKDEQLAHVEHLAAHGGERARADFLTEKARLLEAKDGPSAASVAAFREALALAPAHAGATYGLEAALDATGQWADLAAHLVAVAELADDPAWAAWLHVERAILLDRRGSDPAAARAALDQALALAPGQGPVLDAAIDHAVLHHDDARLATLLEQDAAGERDPARAARLELDAALAWLRTGSERERAIKLLEKAFGRAPTTRVTDLRVADVLARLLERDERHADLLRVRKAALKLAGDPRAEVVALRAVAVAAEHAGALDDAVLALERARVSDVDDPTLLSELDRLLAGAQRHEARAVTWMREAARVEEPERKARALLIAAEAARAAGREDDAAKYLQSAWVSAPAAPGTFDKLAERLGSAGSRAAVEARVSLYEQAARTTSDPSRKLYYLEKIAWLWDDVAGDPAQASRAYEDVLALDEARVSAIAGLASAATRAGDARRLARALLAEAAATEDAAHAAEAKLRAAEALAYVDAERALALAEELRKAKKAPKTAARAAETVTRLHANAGRWELVATTLEQRREAESTKAAKVALALAEVDVLVSRLGVPERALGTLAAVRKEIPDDPAIAKATIDALEALGDRARLRKEHESLGKTAATPELRAVHLVRASELADEDAEAVALLVAAREVVADEPLATERLRRVGARADVPAELVSPFQRAVRTLDRDVPVPPAEPLLASETRVWCTVRLAERLARRTGSPPQLANALAMQIDLAKGAFAMRAHWGIATLVTWALPEGDDIEPWERLVAAGSEDAVALDAVIVRGRADLGPEAVRRRILAAADETERLVLLLDAASFAKNTGAVDETKAACRAALAIDGTSVAAAALLGELAQASGDRPAAIQAASALADVTVDARARAELLRDAADLAGAAGDTARAAELLERALDSDPENVAVAARLAQLQIGRRAYAELARVLRRGLQAAKTETAIVPMASELAEVARHQLKDPLVAIEALERAREVAPGHVPSLFNLAELYIGQRAWQKALAALGDVVEKSPEKDEKVVAHVGRASIFAKVLDQATDAEKELRAALHLDPHDARAAAALLKLPGVVSPEERAELLGRLAIAEPQANERLSALLELAEVRRAIGDLSGAEGALVEAAALSPDAKMLERVRAAVPNDPETIARVLGRAVMRARESNRTPHPAWLVMLGDTELGLGRVDEAIERFESVLEVDPSRQDVRVQLARALAKRGRHETAASALAPLLEKGHFPSAGENGHTSFDHSFVRLLDETLSGAGRTQQAQVARELRAIAGDLDDAGRNALMSRRRAYGSDGEPLGGSSLRSFVMPNALGKHAFWDVAQLAAPFAGKLAKVTLASQGSSTKDRMKPKAMNPVRQVFDRVARAFELVEVELAVSDHVATPSLAVEDVPWVVVPSALGDWPEAHAIAALARPLSRIALGIPWFGALSPNEVLALVVAFGRQVAPSFSATPSERIEPLVGDFEVRARKAIDRKRRRMLEELGPTLDGAPPIDETAFADAVLRTETRAAFLLSGDLRAALDALAVADPSLADAIRVPGPNALSGVLRDGIARDLVSYALSGDATALRHSLGTLWA